MPLFCVPNLMVKRQVLLVVWCSELPLCFAAKHWLIVEVAVYGPNIFNREIFNFLFLVLDWRTGTVGTDCNTADSWLQQTLSAALLLNQVWIARVFARKGLLSETS